MEWMDNHMPTTRTGELASIDMDMSIAFLAQNLGGYLSEGRVDKRSSAYAKALTAFELLCNLNFRDREIALELISGDVLTSLYDMFPNVVSALFSWASGDLIATRQYWVAHLKLVPSDIVVSFMLHMLDFLHGHSDCYEQYLFDDARCGSPRLGGFYQGVLAFSLCEQGRYIEALPIALEAHQKNTNDVYSLHALVHAWHGVENHGAVVNHLQQVDAWRHNAGMNIHVSWHMAISLLQSGRLEPSVTAYRAFRALTAGHDAEQDLDAVNYCIRLYCSQLPGPDFSTEYALLARNWAPSIYNSLSYFNDLHAAIAFMLAGDRTLLRKLKKRPPIRVLDKDLQKVGSQLISAISSFADGDYMACARELHSSQSQWYRIGGSRAQREILEILLKFTLRFAGVSPAKTSKSEATSS
jgi:tetratricopeptide (TPR) repeat protein